MSCILFLETATKVCSVAIAENLSAMPYLSAGKPNGRKSDKACENLLAVRESHSANSHSSVITTFISEAMEASGKKRNDIDAVCVSMGPGSYTGLRIGVSTAKGLCYAWNKPLIAVNTLQSMAMHFLAINADLKNTTSLLCPMIDARRMEVYNALFDSTGKFIRETTAEIITENSFSDMLQKQKIIFFGDGAAKCKEILSEYKNALIIDDNCNSAKGMMEHAFLKYDLKQFEDTAYFEPYYLKDFLATIPKQLI